MKVILDRGRLARGFFEKSKVGGSRLTGIRGCSVEKGFFAFELLLDGYVNEDRGSKENDDSVGHGISLHEALDALAEILIEGLQPVIQIAQAIETPVGIASVFANKVLLGEVGSDGSEKGFAGVAERQVKLRHGLERIQDRATAGGHEKTEEGIDANL